MQLALAYYHVVSMNLDDSEGAMAFEDTFLMDLDDSDGDGGADLHIDFKDETVSESDISGTEVDTR
jgi:hypothetical protein